MNKSSLIWIVGLVILSACKNTNRMTFEEIAIIEQADTITPMRVMKIDNTEDSLLLRSICKDVDYKKDRDILQKLFSRLKATMIAESGIGIAAPQVGILRNIFLFVRIDKPEHPVEVAINPKIIAFSQKKYIFEGDGCLSVPDRKGNSLRYKWIDVEYLRVT
jgi:peptide deformylase